MLFDLPKQEKSIIKVIGVGGGGGNAVAHMHKQGIFGVDFSVCNTDNQALDVNPISMKIQLGPHLTEGRGAGTKPEIGKQACIESIDEVREFLADGTRMLFITAGLGGGTGTGAAPIIAKAAKEMDILTVGIVTMPFKFEGLRRQRQAIEGLEELKACVDAILVISNDKLREIYGNLTITAAFAEADNILTTAAKGIAEIIMIPGYINVDFEDVNTVMRESGVAIMGTAVEQGDDRARKAIHKALNSPLLEDNDIRGARHILLNISSGTQEVTMNEIGEITEYVQEEAGYGTDIVWGNCKDDALGDKLSITLIATGFQEDSLKRNYMADEKIVVALDEKFDIKEEEGIDVGFAEGQNTHVVDFDMDLPRYKGDPEVNRKYTYEEPYEKVQVAEPMTIEAQKRMEMEAARREFLRKNINKNLDNPKSLGELEGQPAYKRRNVVLDDLSDQSGKMYSRYTVSMDEDNPIQRNNQFLHDNVD